MCLSTFLSSVVCFIVLVNCSYNVFVICPGVVAVLLFNGMVLFGVCVGLNVGVYIVHACSFVISLFN